MPASHIPEFSFDRNKIWNLHIKFGVCFSSPEPKAQASHYHSAPSVTHPSVRRPALTLTSLQPLEGIQRNLTGSKISTSPIEFVFFEPIGTSKMAALVSDWQGQFSISPLKPLNRIQRNFTRSKISTSPTKFMVFGSIEKQDDSPGLWFAEAFSTSPLKPLNRIQKLDSKKDLNVFNQVCVFGLIRNTRWPSRPLIGWDIWSRWMEFNEIWQEGRSQWQVCVFVPVWKTRWPPSPLIGWYIFGFSSKTA